jgi:hypothetical protein
MLCCSCLPRLVCSLWYICVHTTTFLEFDPSFQITSSAFTSSTHSLYRRFFSFNMSNRRARFSTVCSILAAIGSEPVAAANESYYPKSLYVSPSPNATGIGWEIAFAKAQAFTANLSLEEKVGMVTGNSTRQNPRQVLLCLHSDLHHLMSC